MTVVLLIERVFFKSKRSSFLQRRPVQVSVGMTKLKVEVESICSEVFPALFVSSFSGLFEVAAQ